MHFPLAATLLTVAVSAAAGSLPRPSGWLHRARYGAFMHYLPSSPGELAAVKEFDVEGLAAQLSDAGASYLILSLGQNSGYFISPNKTYDRATGYLPGERCSTRDLPMELYEALNARGIRLMLYLPCQPPNRDPRAQAAFGLPVGPVDQPLAPVAVKRWAAVIREWSVRYGHKVAGWWFDGAYRHIGFNDAIADVYSGMARHGYKRTIVAFNPGIEVARWGRNTDYTAGELNEPFTAFPDTSAVDGAQWHVLTYLGSTWGARNARYPDARWTQWLRRVLRAGGVVTFDVGPNMDTMAGPIGLISDAQLAQLRAFKAVAYRQKRESSDMETEPAAPGPQVSAHAQAAAVPTTAVAMTTTKPAVSIAAPSADPTAPPLRRGPGRPAQKPAKAHRIQRRRSFLGIHFDFHAGDDCTEIGKNTTPEMIEKIIEMVHPDYVQTDCKGHPGLSSYRTTVGNQAPGFVGDPLRIWREVTAAHGVSLFVHYSGVWDSEAIRKNPSWAVVNADGSRNPNATSVFSPYADQLLIPQLRELANEYGVDGAWVDGECWATVPDYGEAAVAAFRAATGIAEPPRSPADPHWFEWLQFHREAFRRYLRHYVEELKRSNPVMEICSNWAFSDHMPEPVSAKIHWNSGDFSPENAVNSARISARYLASQEKVWDLMAWSFAHARGREGWVQKPARQLMREAAIVVAAGGGFQAYFTQNRDGSVRLGELEVMAEVARFCRDRQRACFCAGPVNQVAVVYSTANHYREEQGLFSRDLSAFQGTLQAIIENQYSVELVGEHHLGPRLPRYPLVVIPEVTYLEPAFIASLLRYVRGGGRLLLVGAATAAMFRDAFVDPRPAGAGNPEAVISVFGHGQILATNAPFSRAYLAHRSPGSRREMGEMVRLLFPNPIVELSGPGAKDVDVVVNRNRGSLRINLINTSGRHDDPGQGILDTIEPLGEISLTIRPHSRPTQVILEPGGMPLPHTIESDGTVHLTLPGLDIHSIVTLR